MIGVSTSFHQGCQNAGSQNTGTKLADQEQQMFQQQKGQQQQQQEQEQKRQGSSVNFVDESILAVAPISWREYAFVWYAELRRQ